jgi:hypothetical protein
MVAWEREAKMTQNLEIGRCPICKQEKWMNDGRPCGPCHLKGKLALDDPCPDCKHLVGNCQCEVHILYRQ